MAHGYQAKALPQDLNAPAFVDAWRSRALMVGGVFLVLAVILGFVSGDHWNHFLRAWLHGYMMCFNFTFGAMALLFVQYLSGGKWGLIIRRPLEAMTRTWPLVLLLFLPVGILGASMGQLYSWAKYADWATALKNGQISLELAHAIRFKHGILNTGGFWAVSLLSIGIMALYATLLNRWSLKRDADPEPNVTYWRTKFENLSGFGLLFYSILLFICVIYWVMSLDPTWYSTVYGFQFLVAQGYGVFALALLTLMGLSKAEPIRSTFRLTEQHDMGKLCFAFTMLNMYLAFAAFLIIWSGNSPEEIPWYLDRIRGNWGVIATLDVIFHWLIPFTLLLSASLKRIKSRLAVVCCIMIFARAWDLWWLIEPNFPDARRNLHFSVGMLEYATLPVALVAFWLALFFTELKKRPLLATNDPHLEEILEAEHAHA
jgi:hypothetical protein